MSKNVPYSLTIILSEYMNIFRRLIDEYKAATTSYHYLLLSLFLFLSLFLYLSLYIYLFLLINIYIYIQTEITRYKLWMYLPNPSARAGYDTRSIFAEFNRFEFSVFLLQHRLPRLKSSVCSTIYPYIGEE